MTEAFRFRILQHGPAGSPVRESFTPADPKPGWARLELKAMALNRLDLWTTEGIPGYPLPLPKFERLPGQQLLILRAYDEVALFNRKVPHLGIKQVYGLKRRCAVIMRTLGRTMAVLGPMKAQARDDQGLLADVVEEADRLHTWADELLENATHLMHLEINLASQRTNEVMRVLTIFSAFFLPLTFIAGVYGMNFRRMPELEHRFGYPLVIAAMVLTALAIWAWFRRKGWLR